MIGLESLYTFVRDNGGVPKQLLYLLASMRLCFNATYISTELSGTAAPSSAEVKSIFALTSALLTSTASGAVLPVNLLWTKIYTPSGSVPPNIISREGEA